jgi:hypothetical protein
MRIESGGNIGIGTSSINNPSAGRQVVEINGASDGALLNMSVGGSRYGYLYTTASGTELVSTNSSLAFKANDIERMRIHTSGALVQTSDGANNGSHVVATFRKDGIADNTATNLFKLSGAATNSIYGLLEIHYSIDDPGNNLFVGRRVYRMFYNGATSLLDLITSETSGTVPTFSLGTISSTEANIQITLNTTHTTYNTVATVAWTSFGTGNTANIVEV